MRVLLVSSPLGTAVASLIANLGYDVEVVEPTEIQQPELHLRVLDYDVPATPSFGKLKDSLNHLPYQDRKKFWLRR